MMNDPRGSGQATDPDRGLCSDCAHAQTIVTSRGSRFLLCRVSVVDSRYPRYPVLPVRRCAAWNAVE